MSYEYEVQIKFGSKWTTVKTTRTHSESLKYVTDTASETNKYPKRIVQLRKTVIFDETAKKVK